MDKDNLDQSALLALLGAELRPVASHPKEADFEKWMQSNGVRYPERPEEFYDYRRAMMAGASRDESGHWPSTFKREGHPNMVVGGFHVKTGQRVPGATLAKNEQELVDLGWDAATAKQLWANR